MSTQRLTQLEKLHQQAPDDTFVLYALAQELTKQGDLARAIEFYDRCIAIDPTYCYAYFHKARVQQSTGDVVGALKTVEAGILAAQKAGDGKALNELSGLKNELL